MVLGGQQGLPLRSPRKRSRRQNSAIAVRCASLVVLACRWLAAGGSPCVWQRSDPSPILSLPIVTAARKVCRVAAETSLQDGRLKELVDSINVSLTFKRREPSQYGSSFVKLARSDFCLRLPGITTSRIISIQVMNISFRAVRRLKNYWLSMLTYPA